MGETIGDMDIELQQKDNKIHFSEDKIVIAEVKVGEILNKLDLNKLSKKQKIDRKMYRINKNFIDHIYIIT